MNIIQNKEKSLPRISLISTNHIGLKVQIKSVNIREIRGKKL